MRQLGLFSSSSEGDNSKPLVTIDPLITDEDRALAARVPHFIHFGTSSWSFPGWSGIVWKGQPSENDLAKSGLEAYAQQPLLRAVGLDRSYYGPLRAQDVASYKAQLASARTRAAERSAGASATTRVRASHPAAAADAAATTATTTTATTTTTLPPFRMLAKVWEEITTAIFPKHPRYGARAGERNPFFLNVERFEIEVLAPYIQSGWGDGIDAGGPFLFELTPMPQGAIDERTLVARVDDFISRLPSPSGPTSRLGHRWAFELRNAELFGTRWLDMLRANRAAHVFAFWTAMPPLQMQLRARGVTAPFTVIRLMLPPYTRYAARKADLAPFNKIVEEQTEMRDDVVDILRAAAEAGCEEGFVLVNNKAEGSAPLTVRALAKKTAAAFLR